MSQKHCATYIIDIVKQHHVPPWKEKKLYWKVSTLLIRGRSWNSDLGWNALLFESPTVLLNTASVIVGPTHSRFKMAAAQSNSWQGVRQTYEGQMATEIKYSSNGNKSLTDTKCLQTDTDIYLKLKNKSCETQTIDAGRSKRHEFKYATKDLLRTVWVCTFPALLISIFLTIFLMCVCWLEETIYTFMFPWSAQSLV